MEELLIENLIKKTVIAVFNGSDKHQWDAVKHSFADEVQLDYSSLNGQPAAPVKVDDIITDRSHFLPKFKFTLHLITNIEIHLQGGKATVFCKGEALHCLPHAEGGEVWKVYGTYDIELAKLGEHWKITGLRFNLMHQEGNINLPVIAAGQK
ncbi:MAG: nuclear transport factor 2 family protein [Spirosomataceae bacterium]